MPNQPQQPDQTAIADGWQVIPDVAGATPRRSARRRIAGLATVVVLSLGLFGVGSLLSGGNTASAMAGHPEVLREGCTWDSSGNYVQNCKVWSESQNKYVIVQIRASNGSDQGVYLLDGMRAQEDRSAWTKDVQAAEVYDGSTDTTLVMPVGGASSFYTDWDAGAGADNTTIQQETFLTEELPDYLAENFGVSKNNNAIVGLSMSGGPAVTLAERHPDQFKVVQAMSGYYQTDNPIGALGVFASQTIVSNYTNGIVNMWGEPGSQRWTDNDPSKNVNKLNENGQVLIISSGNGFLTSSEMAKLSQEDQISAMALEMLSAVSTVLMQLQAAQSGASVISLPNYGGHTWENWGRGLADGKDHVLEALRNNPPVTEKVQVVDASGTPDPEGSTKATQAALVAAKSTPVLDSVELSADPSSSAVSAESSTPVESKPGESSTPAESSSATDSTSATSGTSGEVPTSSTADSQPSRSVAASESPAVADTDAPTTSSSVPPVSIPAQSSIPTTTPVP
ncbi:esterase family protein [Gordonia sp. HNM0687]|uniref:Esterase family protein n=1 Tax=Gordonia mangrovi TaxID=2665643 RepID=A0A6L7GTX5_9ACTN|nr:alpha/beta hydrolase family protein [Gordonia mangrovi]MXP22942.1 esterase family protein [Gordonia mangrovi]UVF77240.1 alpha/beta hydrolase-fold protein [Gordonia mangrovi]